MPRSTYCTEAASATSIARFCPASPICPILPLPAPGGYAGAVFSQLGAPANAMQETICEDRPAEGMAGYSAINIVPKTLEADQQNEALLL